MDGEEANDNNTDEEIGERDEGARVLDVSAELQQ